MVYSILYIHGTRPFWCRFSEFLVHRRFRKEPAFCNNSTGNPKLDRAVAEALSPGVTEFECFRWSGANSFRERSAAARRLADRLEELACSQGDRQIYLIAHSHGGSVAIEALARVPGQVVGDAICGLVCGATPFIIKGRSEPARAIASGFAPALGIFVALLHLWFHWCALGIPVFLVCGVLLGFFSPLLLKWAHQRSLEKLAGIPDQCPVKNLLILRKPGDEASEALGFAHLLAWTLGRLWHRASHRQGKVWGWLISHLLLALILPATIIVLGPIALAFGMDGINPAMFVEVFMESAPVGEWPVHMVQGKATGAKSVPALRHSVFEDDDVISELERWLRLHRPHLTYTSTTCT